mmetsp:Transcript_36402/g.41514  ORF Transcript_36402/g.41514 Transcript_36402/m.41514 type:complete len:273 (-) Transcript_36402:306-1124(-)|eukprot:CAMPEP_0194150174 /NCGR_PEP_ID=MMETSP0152-20130528/41849_1 /TAXON_ID=1049557 /ORGANISM="Thalassiothrix antarctica, Strain L6-D1" /LENGTH=272 /DNA_ID=CAMNT_0038852895 /DNA_START=44 /DNA_END=862 /DNA_ORIENTATION=-
MATASKASSSNSPWAPKPVDRPKNELPKISVIGGTGRMGVHLCAAWANAGYDVTMCSRTKEKAQVIVDELLSGKGYQKKVEGKNSGQGDYSVPPCEAKEWKLQAGDNTAAANADLIVLSTMYEKTWSILEEIAPEIKGKGKKILDMTNPFMKRPDGFGAGLPKDGPQAGIIIHKAKLDDPTTKWAGAYKHVLWTLILPNGPKNPSRPDIEVFGDKEAVDDVVELIYRHGWRPIVRGGIEVAPKYEGGKVSFGKIFGNIRREMKKGEKLSVGW